MLPPSLDAARDTELEQMHSAADSTLAVTRQALVEAMDDTDEHGILPLARLAGATVVRNHAEFQQVPAVEDKHPASEESTPQNTTGDPTWAGHTALLPIVELEPTSEDTPAEASTPLQITPTETPDSASKVGLTAVESAAVEAAVKGETLPPEALAALLAEPSAPPSPATHDTGENTRAINWATPSSDKTSTWMMPIREPAAALPAPESEQDNYVSVMADVEIPDGVREAFVEQTPMSPAEFDKRMTQLNAERNLLEKALSDGEIAPEDLGSTKARLTLVMQRESELLAKGTGGNKGSSDSLETMERILLALRKI
jgi:hypothetical protein